MSSTTSTSAFVPSSAARASVLSSWRSIPREEFGNVSTHFFGATISVGWLVTLGVFAWSKPWPIFVGCFVFGLTLCLTFLISTVYHSAVEPKFKNLMRVLDHCVIYVLIAATHTSSMLVIPSIGFHWDLFAIAWFAATVGIVHHWKMADTGEWTDRDERFSLSLYVALGLLGFAVVGPHLLSADRAIRIFGFGGAVYLLGVPFYVADRSRPLYIGHEIWHVFTCIAAVLHSVAHLLSVWN